MRKGPSAPAARNVLTRELLDEALAGPLIVSGLDSLIQDSSALEGVKNMAQLNHLRNRFSAGDLDRERRRYLVPLGPSIDGVPRLFRSEF